MARLSEDDIRYLEEEMERLSTFARSKNVVFLMEKQYEGWCPKFHRYHDKIGGERATIKQNAS